MLEIPNMTIGKCHAMKYHPTCCLIQYNLWSFASEKFSVRCEFNTCTNLPYLVLFTIGPSDHTVYLLTYGSDHPARCLLNCLQQTLGENYTASYFFNSLQARFLVNHLFCFWKSFKSFIMIYQTAPLAPNTLLAFSMYLQLLQNSGECELESDSCKRCWIKIFSRTIYFLSVDDPGLWWCS